MIRASRADRYLGDLGMLGHVTVGGVHGNLPSVERKLTELLSGGEPALNSHQVRSARIHG
jgi:hypothetical protein